MNIRKVREKNIMPENLESKNIEKLLAEAEELIHQIDSNSPKKIGK